MIMLDTVNIFWFRRDLRLHDNTGLHMALRAGLPVVPIFIFDTDILDKLEDKADRRVEFIHQRIQALQEKLTVIGSSMEVYHGKPLEIIKSLINKYKINSVFTNNDYEPYAIQRDRAVQTVLEESRAQFKSYKDHVIFEKNEVMKDDGLPYTVFTPYSRKWKGRLQDDPIQHFSIEENYIAFFRQSVTQIPTLQEMGFEATGQAFPAGEVPLTLIKEYAEKRNFPGIVSTSRLGVHLRFGTISTRELAKKALASSETFLNELVWRDFYQMILWNFPSVGEGRSFKPAYDRIKWRNNEAEFERWCNGTTGYPIVDAGMRELNQTGFMHNRVRMIVASFLCKHLLIDWRWGEAYFASKLLDYDFASNNGGWQWASGSGCDAAPYFRIFNPYLQTEKFDKKLTYISKWVPEFQEFGYPPPIVAHEFARKRCLEVYTAAVGKLQQ